MLTIALVESLSLDRRRHGVGTVTIILCSLLHMLRRTTPFHRWLGRKTFVGLI